MTTPSDFGTLGTTPSHPELIDWLASRFITDGWHWKSLHRMIVTSETYCQSATHPQAADFELIDPANKLRWRWDVRRLSAEQFYDALQSVAGRLNNELGGRSTSDGRRRAIYRKVYRNKPDSVLALFDTPDGVNSMPLRPTTTTPNQALALLNSDWALEIAAAMADRVHALSLIHI